ncbi:transcription elongation factor GreA [Pediococcus ethanolidurans]|uniref:Transcription elongation factor GreA n=1 Tax=Pediococcus ethanolidurans TaxID=319653 RepID=A0A0R2K7A4_9LACO|nr:transcription elongation factor GreA [Pediococcus ethanolidurans]KRN82490.1 transcription elongation factor GreA [Pediococcus ethanolidurans]MBU7563912.1 transcription elongation factor GreA [Pediococcus ethanolidurans]MCT4397480.1 transcription elongation factor GreA [Pediococcus ethanolidurans]MCV3314358.1 transcription elongation factor GreA [Pediococcus ethanolidurans]MCV3320677.1 transcription elongation factor GreA [Pediococcus ethanolidurans]
MANEKTYPMTEAGRKKLEDELNEKKTKTRPEVIERIKIARGFGDLSENSEYESAKDEQSMVESRISTIEHMLQNAEIIDNNAVAKDVVSLGKTVEFKELPDEEPESYTIVGAAEADPMSGKISNDSPIAKALLDHKVGDQVVIATPGGDMNVQILSVKAE